MAKQLETSTLSLRRRDFRACSGFERTSYGGDCVGAACMESGPNAGTTDDADAAFPSGCGIACISVVSGLASTPGVS